MNGLHTCKRFAHLQTVYTPAGRHNPHDPSVQHASIKRAQRQPSWSGNAACIVNWPDLSRHEI